MTEASLFDDLMGRVSAGDQLTQEELSQLAATPDILPLGMLADAIRRKLHGTQVTYLRVAVWSPETPLAEAFLPSAREIRITGTPASLDAAVAAVSAARVLAVDRPVSAFSWADVERIAAAADYTTAKALAELRAAGLETLAHLPLDRLENAETVLGEITASGYRRVRLTIDKAPAAERMKLMIAAARLQEQFVCIQAINPLPMSLDALRPTTGYDDVKSVAIARLAAPNIPSVQVDWLRYGPKLAQVALTFGADDVDNVSASDDAPDGSRRAPLTEVRRNIEAAGFEPAERDGRFAVIA